MARMAISTKKGADTGERAVKKRRLSKPYRHPEDIIDSESDKDEPQERDRHDGSRATVGIRDRTRGALARNEATEVAQDDEETDTDDFQTRHEPTRPIVRGRRHEYGQIHGSSSNNTATTTRRDLTKIPPYPEHILSTLPERPARTPSAQTWGTTNTSSPPNPATQAPSRKRPLPRVPSHIYDAPRRVPGVTATTALRKPKVEEMDGERGPLRPSQSLPEEGHPHESDVYKAMEDHGTDLWRDWCKRMAYSDKDRVTALKLKDYIDLEVMPKDREMMRKSWRLPGHPDFIAVSALEANIRPVVRLWYEQSLEAELETIRDAKLKSTRSQQPQQPLRPQTPNSQPRQAKPKTKLRQPKLRLPPITAFEFESTNQQLVTGSTEDKENIGKEGKEAKGKKEIGEQEKGGAAKDDDSDKENNTGNNRDGGANISDNHTTSDSSETNGKDPTGKDDERDAAAKRIPLTTSKLVAPSTPTLPTAPSIPAPAPPPTSPSSQPPAGKSRILAKNIQLLRILDLASPRIDFELSSKAIKHRLNPRVTSIADVLTEWTVGIEGGPSIRQLNNDYGMSWQHNDDEKEYSDREAIVLEFKRLVFEDGETDQEAQKLLEDELTLSSKADLAARLRTSRRASLSSLTAGDSTLTEPQKIRLWGNPAEVWA
ncbi:hypothetical protein EC957_001413 [Mortierella hygrophila]|uniref:Transcription activator GCR1-like domain-containing protein n=1 Tax=Mortierella hygrophila TaxID=979708 RepID=A0A9P6F6H4_9FUNG|nr:hypothetical protein EC957_001413 [Mortierella hygrophila]